jgi:superfamily I DNA/RNA helicase
VTGPLFSHPKALKIFGPAGAGKTHELVNILGEHVAEEDFDLLDGIIVSFTRAAAYDIARRANSDRAPGRYHTTLHALCKRYYGFEGEIADLRLKEFFKQENIPYVPGRVGDGEEWAASDAWTKSEGGQLMAFFSLCRNQFLSIEEGRRLYPPGAGAEHWWVGKGLESVWSRYLAWKRENDLYDFTDMLEYAVANPPQRSRWAFFVLDEGQDASPLQWAVAQSFAARAEVVYLAGDDDQAIYQWLGASPREFLEAATSLTDILHVNHRSGRAIVDRAQEFIRKNRQRQDKATMATRDGGVITTVDMPDLDINESTFVMARAHYVNEPLMLELTRQGFPFVDKRGKYGVNGKAATAYHRFLSLYRGQAITLDELRLLYDAIPSAGPWLSRGIKKRLREMDKEQLRSTHVRLSDLTSYGAMEQLVDAVRAEDVKPLGRLGPEGQERLQYLRNVERRCGVDFLDERRAAQVCSVGPVHSFKGLEADHAVIHEAWSPAALREASIDPEPERRVAYVAMTRAKDRITFVPGRWDHDYKTVL